MYNKMKIRFDKSQVMTYGKALTLISSSPNVHMLDAKNADFKAYGHFFNTLYKKFPTGKIFKNHIFVASKIDCNVLMKISTHDGVPMETLDMVRNEYVPDADRAAWTKEYRIPFLVPSGLKYIKAVELYTKYLQLLQGSGSGQAACKRIAENKEADGQTSNQSQ
jgi:hypothetical protein